MAWHIIITFHSVFEGSIVVPRGWDNLVQSNLHIPTNIWICVFVHGQTSRCVLNEQIAHSNLDLRQILGNCLLNICCNQMTTTGGRRDGEFVLKPLHAHVDRSAARMQGSAAAAASRFLSKGGKKASGDRNEDRQEGESKDNRSHHSLECAHQVRTRIELRTEDLFAFCPSFRAEFEHHHL